MMDAKTAVKILRSCQLISTEIGVITAIIQIDVLLLADLIEEQEKYAELGRLAVSTKHGICSIESYREYGCENEDCLNIHFCQKRAELLGGGQYMDDQQTKVDKIYEFVRKWEDFYYDKIGDDQNKNMLITFQATSYQRVRYFIENMMEDEKNGQ